MANRIGGVTIWTLTAVCMISSHTVWAGGEKQTLQESRKEKIMQIANDWVLALLSGSVERNLAFYTDEVVVAGGQSQDVYVGRAQVEKLLTQLLRDTKPTHCSIKVKGIHIIGNWAELRAAFKAVWEPRRENIKSERESSNYIWLLRRQPDD